MDLAELEPGLLKLAQVRDLALEEYREVAGVDVDGEDLSQVSLDTGPRTSFLPAEGRKGRYFTPPGSVYGIFANVPWGSPPTSCMV